MTRQIDLWKGEFGDAYTDRCDHAPQEHKRHILASVIDRLQPARILDLGCNTGRHLEWIQEHGPYELWGLEPNLKALGAARSRLPGGNLVEGNTCDLPFKDGFFDLVYTVGVLIHISPDDIAAAMREIVRVCRGHVFFYEYYADDWTEVEYRGHNDFLWKADYRKLYLINCPQLEEVQFEILDAGQGLQDAWGLLRMK
ncbi:MAG: methyltransferase domain-containing protein [Proteobacteria bacterium]|nr:methyltransferase domain-containing protein [Pseudomonadota bacterium]MBU1741424.1 methyltransferase domain-containing protein [Pseudomonadota bacterium]